jgi:acyl-CoA reductase-like NAD-dependent aldehyde dehydrogenase
MITNERQYRVTKSEAKKFEDAIAAARDREAGPDVDPRTHQAMIESLESELAVLRDQLAQYEAVRSSSDGIHKDR